MAIEFRNQPGLIVYLTIGDPDLNTSRKIALAAIDAGADVLELGVPFSDPLADGPVIQRASERAIRGGTRLADVLALARRPAPGTSRRSGSSFFRISIRFCEWDSKLLPKRPRVQV